MTDNISLLDLSYVLENTTRVKNHLTNIVIKLKNIYY